MTNIFFLIKLCGYELEIDFPKETDELMHALSNCENTDSSTQRLLTSVIELRRNRWVATTIIMVIFIEIKKNGIKN